MHWYNEGPPILHKSDGTVTYLLDSLWRLKSSWACSRKQYEADPKDKLSIGSRLSLKGAKPMCLHKDVLNQWLWWKHPEHLLCFIDLCSTNLFRFPCSHYFQVVKRICSASLFNTSLKIWMSASYSGFRAACLVHLISEDLETKGKIQPFYFKGKYSPYFFVLYIPHWGGETFQREDKVRVHKGIQVSSHCLN